VTIAAIPGGVANRTIALVAPSLLRTVAAKDSLTIVV
jgi:hypothetical protein